MLLIADSGASKTSWAYQNMNKKWINYETLGLNPYTRPEAEITNIIKEVAQKFPSVQEIFFYGAGCVNKENKNLIKNICESQFLTLQKIEIDNDLMGAAKALCGNQKGNIAILGTGSNLAYFDGKNLYGEEFNLGYILGDEGSGAYLGKQLLKMFLHQKLPLSIHEKLLIENPTLHRDFILQNIYKQPNPNRFLAKFTTFIKENIENEVIKNIVIQSFDQFLQTYLPLLPVESQKFSIHFVGSIAFYFQEELKMAVDNVNYKIGKILKNPIEGLKEFHLRFYT
jgi:N-acetylglucosamine kinase-like BadF-type ATPase